MAEDYKRYTPVHSSERPHWIHSKIKDPRFTSGFKYSLECTCSVCGLVAAHEMPVCPGCHSRMS